MPIAEQQGLAGAGFTPGQFADYEEEAFPSPSFVWIPGKPLQIRKRYYLYTVNRLHEFLNALTGWPFVVDGVLYRNLPELISPAIFDAVTDPSNPTTGWQPNYYCTEILSVVPEVPNLPNAASLESAGNPAELNSHSTFTNSQGQWSRYIVEARFEQPLYSVAAKTDISSEVDRYTFIREKSVEKAVHVNGTSQSISWDPSDGPFNGPISTAIEIPLATELVVLDWLDVPPEAFDVDRIKSYYGTVNVGAWPASEAYPEGTLLLKSFNKNLRRHQLGFSTYDLQFIFLYNQNLDSSGSIVGHNSALTKSLDFQKIQKNGSVPVFDSNDFDQLFLG